MDSYGNTKKKITKLNIFDLDGTLIKSPLPEFGKPLYEKKTGTPWPHSGWWSKPESLDMKIFDIPLIKSTIDGYNKDIADDSVMTVMVTGRMFKLSSYVEAILNHYNLRFDSYHYNTGGSSIGSKLQTFDELVAKLPDLETVEIWDDRESHRESFVKWGQKQDIKFIYNFVENGYR